MSTGDQPVGTAVPDQCLTGFAPGPVTCTGPRPGEVLVGQWLDRRTGSVVRIYRSGGDQPVTSPDNPPARTTPASAGTSDHARAAAPLARDTGRGSTRSAWSGARYSGDTDQAKILRKRIHQFTQQVDKVVEHRPGAANSIIFKAFGAAHNDYKSRTDMNCQELEWCWQFCISNPAWKVVEAERSVS